MTRIVRIKVSGRGTDTDAPSADDLFEQTRDYLEILREVEGAIAEDGQSAIDWRVTNASKNSPVQFELSAMPRQFAVNVDRRADAVARIAADGLKQLESKPERPRFFTDKALNRAENVFKRVTNGLDFSSIDFGGDIPALEITPDVARTAAKNVELALHPVTDKPYAELGSVEGTIKHAYRDGHDHRVLIIRNRLTGAYVKCYLAEEAAEIVEQYKIGDVYAGKRVMVFGKIQYKGYGKVQTIAATYVRFLRSGSALPSVDDILDENFTGGLPTEEYLARLRDGGLS